MLSVVVCSCIKPQRTQVSTSGDAPTTVAVATPSARRVNINTATALELEALPGLGKVLAERIVAHREQNGPFRRAEHLMMVRGFSDNKFRAIRERVTAE
jgi:competence protein ComEA